MHKIGFLVVLVMLTGIAQTVWAENAPTEKAVPPTFQIDTKLQIRVPTPVKIQKAIDASTLLGDDQRVYALVGLDIPDDNATASMTHKRLSELTEQKKCTLFQTRSDKVGRINRMNQNVGHLTCGKNDNWVQGILISEGLARVRTTPENREQAEVMLGLEQKARAAKKGLWANPINAVLTPQNAGQVLNRFGIVEGKVYTTTQSRNSIYINFTSDWHTDFSIGIPSQLRKDFSKKRIDPMSLRGKIVRIRGWLQSYNGPYIELDHAEQLEIVDSTPPSPPVESKHPPAEEPDHLSVEKDFMHTISGPSFSEIHKPDTPSVDKPSLTPSGQKDGASD